MRKLLAFVVALALMAAGRERLVDVLTKTTGTWVGSPPARQ